MPEGDGERELDDFRRLNMPEALEDSRLSMLGRTVQPYEASLLAELPRRRLGSNPLSLPWRRDRRSSAVSSMTPGPGAFEPEPTVSVYSGRSSTLEVCSGGRALGPASSRALFFLGRTAASQSANGACPPVVRTAPAVLNGRRSDRPLPSPNSSRLCRSETARSMRPAREASRVAPSACATIATETDQRGPEKRARAVA